MEFRLDVADQQEQLLDCFFFVCLDIFVDFSNGDISFLINLGLHITSATNDLNYQNVQINVMSDFRYVYSNKTSNRLIASEMWPLSHIPPFKITLIQS